ncbi:hypothetical protein KCU77_g532, partial [Aureobasidium melanogenum]
MAVTSYKKLLTVNETKSGQELVSSSLELLRLSNTTSYDLNNVSARVPNVEPKWTAKYRAISATLGHGLSAWTQQTLRSFRLLLLLAVGPWKKKEEQPKIALNTEWVSVLTGLLIHVLPLTACITLIDLNATSYYLSKHVSTLAFQFLAKFIELLAQASLGSAVFVYLRALYTGPDSVPFGALFAGLQITSVSYLWSLEFAGAITSKSFKRTRRLVFLSLIPLSVVLAVGIGPSIAIALTPTLGDFYNGWAEVWINATEEQIFPSNIDPNVLVYNISSNCATGDCARYGWETAMTIAQSSQQSTVALTTQQGSLALTQDALPNREIRWNTSIGLSGSDSWSGLPSLSATVTIPSKVIAWSLNQLAQLSYFMKLWPAGDQTFTTTSRQPIVTASCAEAHWLNSTTVYTTFSNDSDQYILQSPDLRNLTQSEFFDWVFLDHDELVIQGSSQLKPTVWVLSHYPLASLAEADTALCAISAGYARVQTSVSYTKETFEVGNKLISSETNNVSASTVPVPAIWLNRTLPTLGTLLDNGLLQVDMATFLAASLAISMAQWPKQILEYPNDSPSSVGSSSLADPGIIIGRPRSNQSDWPNPSVRWLGSSTEDHILFPGSEYAEEQHKYRLRMDVSSYGYGYHIDQPTKIIAICVLAMYCLYILVFIVFTLTLNRVHSSAWDSIGELTALAIMSRPDEKLRNTSAGVETVALFKLPMNIRANDKNHLEILFGDDEDGSRSGVVEKDKKYE